jgi:hypothetical protein
MIMLSLAAVQVAQLAPSYRKVGGLHFVRIGRFGFSFFISNPRR